jgi:hypothetical protein
MNTRDIAAHLTELYGVEVGRDTISRVTDAGLKTSRRGTRGRWSVYPIVYFDAMLVRVREDRSAKKPRCYLAVGVNCDASARRSESGDTRPKAPMSALGPQRPAPPRHSGRVDLLRRRPARVPGGDRGRLPAGLYRAPDPRLAALRQLPQQILQRREDAVASTRASGLQISPGCGNQRAAAIRQHKQEMQHAAAMREAQQLQPPARQRRRGRTTRTCVGSADGGSLSCEEIRALRRENENHAPPCLAHPAARRYRPACGWRVRAASRSRMSRPIWGAPGDVAQAGAPRHTALGPTRRPSSRRSRCTLRRSTVPADPTETGVRAGTAARPLPGDRAQLRPERYRRRRGRG